MSTRPASHAGSWYTSDPSELSSELDEWLSQVPCTIDDQTLPIPGARIIIAPHAGYSYSGPAAAWAYKTLDLSKTKRIFLLGPSHALYLPNCALSTHSTYSTPLGPLPLDTTTISLLKSTSKFALMTPSQDSEEHSLEMHLPYIHKRLSETFSSPSQYPPVIPILVGNTSPSVEKEYGEILAPYLSDPTSTFIISSDFCHWGLRFQYTYYLPSTSSTSSSSGINLTRKSSSPTSPTIHESIALLDKQSMKAIESGSHSQFLDNLKETGNTVCGRHPIGVVMAAVEILEKERDGKGEGEGVGEGKGRFKFVRYERSSDCVDVRDSSVSYASAYAVL